MLWKITLVFCFALFYVNGKSLPRHAKGEHKPIAQNEDDIEHFFQRFQDVDEIVHGNFDDEETEEKFEYPDKSEEQDANDNIENFNLNNDDVDNEETDQKNLKEGYSLFENANNQEYKNSMINENENAPRVAVFGDASKLTVSQFPEDEIEALASKISNKYYEDSLRVKKPNNKIAPVEEEDIETENEIFKNDREMSDLFKTIQNDQQDFEDEDVEQPVLKKLQSMFQASNSQQKDQAAIPPMFQGFQEMFRGNMNFKPDQLFGPKIKPNTPNFNSQSKQMEPKVGIGQFGYSSAKMKIASLTEYVKKAVVNAQTQLKQLGPRINANNPPLVLNEVPGLLITLKLKYVEGASSITPFDQSKGIYFNKLYAFTQFKFKQLKYYYDVQIEPLGLFTVPTQMNILLDDTPAKMHISIEKDKKMDLLHFEFVKPKVQIDFGHNLVNYGVNYIIQQYHPVIKNRVVEIVSRDSKLMLESFVKAAQ